MKFKRFLCLLMVFMCLSSFLLVYADPCNGGGSSCPASGGHSDACNALRASQTMNNALGVSADITSNTGDKGINGVKGVGTYEIHIGKLDAEKGKSLTNVLNKYRSVISALSGAGALTMLLFFIINFGKLGASAGNPQQRQSALMGLLFTGIATALLGSIMIFFTFFYKVLT